MRVIVIGAFYTKDKLTAAELEAYTRPPPPPANSFLKQKTGVASLPRDVTSLEPPLLPPPPPPQNLITPLLLARIGAYAELEASLRGIETDSPAASQLAYLIRMGAKVPHVV